MIPPDRWNRRVRPLAATALAVSMLLLVACSTDEPAEDAVVDPPSSTVVVSPSIPPTNPDGPTTTMSTVPARPTSTADPSASVTVGDPLAEADQPVTVIHPPGRTELFVVERAGRIRPLDPAASTGVGDPVLDVSDGLTPQEEEGLLGAAFSPDARYLYLYEVTGGFSSIVAYRVSGDAPDPNSRRVVYRFEQPYENHNGGQLLFGPDEALYLFTGDGGFVSDPQRRALDLSFPHGKILRLLPRPDDDPPYEVPEDNPFVDDPDAIPVIWSSGLRNPWRASFDPVTGDLWIGDVGDFAWEEINVAWADEGSGRGLSFGWSAFEGNERMNEDQPPEGHEAPFLVYGRDEGCSVTAGERYRGDALPDLYGWFVFADFCFGTVWALEVTDDRQPGRQVSLGEVPYPVDVRADSRGELLVVSVDGTIHPIVPR